MSKNATKEEIVQPVERVERVERVEVEDDFPRVEENGDITDFPKAVWSYYKTKGAGDVVTPKTLKKLTGSSTIDVPQHDIYVMGKEKARNGKHKDNKPVFFTKMRIEGKSAERNSVQGLLAVRFTGGYGYMNTDSNLRVMRPTNIDKLVTQDSSQFRKRAVVYVNGHVFALSRVEGFCRIPLMDDRVLAKFEKKSNAKKREAYARRKKCRNEWAHINRETMLEENKKVILGMLLKYKKNLRDKEFFLEFMRDIVTIGADLREEFCSDANIQDLLVGCGLENNKKRHIQEEEDGLEAKRQRVLKKISDNLDTRALSGMSKVKW